MTEEWKIIDEKRKIKTIAIIVTLIIIATGVSALAITSDWTKGIQTQKPQEEYTTYYTSITPQKAQELIKNETNLLVVDTRGCDCDYKEGHIPFAIWATYAPNFYNTAHNLLIYCEDGESSKTYCEQLIGHTYGDIYHLEGGINAWKNAGYQTIKGQNQ